MTKASANPRRYSRGPEGLDENQPLNVYMSLTVNADDFKPTAQRLDYLAGKYTNAELSLVAQRREEANIILTLQVCMGPARLALRGISPQVQAGYALLWDIVRTLFYATPVFVGPPPETELIADSHTQRNTTSPTPDPAQVA